MLLPAHDRHTKQFESFAPSTCLSTPPCMSVSGGKLGGREALVEVAREISGAGLTHLSACICGLVACQCSLWFPG